MPPKKRIDSQETISANEAADRLGIDKETLKQALRDGSFPVGWAYCPSGKRYVYVIPRDGFERFLRGETPPAASCFEEMTKQFARDVTREIRGIIIG